VAVIDTKVLIGIVFDCKKVLEIAARNDIYLPLINEVMDMCATEIRARRVKKDNK
jgi:glycerol-3-phosphate dehydrogenase